MGTKLDWKTLDYYEKELSSLHEEIRDLCDYADDLAEEIKKSESKFFQLKDLFKHIATGIKNQIVDQ